jgi:hypothetical protein
MIASRWVIRRASSFRQVADVGEDAAVAVLRKTERRAESARNEEVREESVLVLDDAVLHREQRLAGVRGRAAAGDDVRLVVAVPVRDERDPVGRLRDLAAGQRPVPFRPRALDLVRAALEGMDDEVAALGRGVGVHVHRVDVLKLERPLVAALCLDLVDRFLVRGRS